MMKPAVPAKAPVWLVCSQPSAQAPVRLYVFPYAGGGPSAYRSWGRKLGPLIETSVVQLPGREMRMRENPFEDFAVAQAAMLTHVVPQLRAPYFFYGHSMGALQAWSLAREIVRLGGQGPQAILLAGSRPPARATGEPPITHLPDADFVRELSERYNGIPAEVLAHRELLDLLLPLWRADIRVCESFVHTPGPALKCLLYAMGGTKDPHVGREDLDAWRVETSGPFRLKMLQGDHFFPQERESDVLEAIELLAFEMRKT